MIDKKREEIKDKRIDQIAIADTIYHAKYGILSHQPLMTSEYSNGNKLRTVDVKRKEVWVNLKDKLYYTTKKERDMYWRDFHKEKSRRF